MSDELKPCPFCKSDMWQHEGTTAGELWYSCQNCSADTPVSIHVIGYDYTEATELANTRPVEDALRAELAAARAEAEKYRGALEFVLFNMDEEHPEDIGIVRAQVKNALREAPDGQA